MQLESRVPRCRDAGRPAYGGWCILNSPGAVEIMAGGLDIDFLVIDQQHSPVGADDTVHQLRAMQAANPEITPFVRIPTQDKYWIEQSLDAGYVGLIVPLVESAEQAKALVQAAGYPPEGSRSQAGTIRANLVYGASYFEEIGRRRVLLPQVESAVGLEHCEAIANVPGVSGLFLGPLDLCLSCGWPPKEAWSHPPFMAAVNRFLSACQDAGKIAATVTVGLEGAQRARAAGFQCIAFAHDGVDLRVEMIPRVQSALAALANAGGRQ